MKSYVVFLRIVCLLLDLRKEKKENYVPRDLLQIFECICHLHSRVRPKFSPSYRLDSENFPKVTQMGFTPKSLWIPTIKTQDFTK